MKLNRVNTGYPTYPHLSRCANWWLWPNRDGSLNETTKSSSRNWGWDTSKAADGVAFTTMPLSRSPPMVSWWQRGAVFPPQPEAGILDYQLPNCQPPSGRAARIRPERHHPYSIATLRIILARSLLRQLCHCPF